MQQENFTTAKDLLTALRLSDFRWTPQDQYQSSWVFRGHADAAWELKPKAWRNNDGSFESLKSTLRPSVTRNIKGGGIVSSWSTEQVEWRIEIFLTYATVALAVTQFIEFQDQLGFPIPRALQNTIIEVPEVFPEKWQLKYFDITYPNENCVALACHHGIATHFLDFTYNPLVAAFFAATDNNDATELAIWAFDTKTLGHQLGMITCPRNENDYLRAQAGVFLHWENAGDRAWSERKWLSLNSALGPQTTGIRKLILPRDQESELLRLLWVEQITKAHLMPTRDNVAETLRSMWRTHEAE